MKVTFEEKLGQFVRGTAIAAPMGLSERIILFLEEKMKARAKARAILYCGLSAVSGVALYVTGGAVVSDFAASGAGTMLSLVFSDFHSVLANWNYFLLSLAESLPVLPLALAFVSIGVLAAMVTLAVADFRKVGSINQALFGRR
ncbi:hypothetical protein M1432_02395 [Patescibacteria group bacterium]|nr:hypothetical protein [Patescibacteria group bacterium]